MVLGFYKSIINGVPTRDPFVLFYFVAGGQGSLTSQVKINFTYNLMWIKNAFTYLLFYYLISTVCRGKILGIFTPR